MSAVDVLNQRVVECVGDFEKWAVVSWDRDKTMLIMWDDYETMTTSDYVCGKY